MTNFPPTPDTGAGVAQIPPSAWTHGLSPDGALAQPVGAMATREPEPSTDRQVDHHEPILTGGASGDAVVRLVKLLAYNGYGTNSIIQGENPANVLDNTVMSDVRRFWADHPDAQEPEELTSLAEGDTANIQGLWIGPYTWQKLYELTSAQQAAATAGRGA